MEQYCTKKLLKYYCNLINFEVMTFTTMFWLSGNLTTEELLFYFNLCAALDAKNNPCFHFLSVSWCYANDSKIYYVSTLHRWKTNITYTVAFAYSMHVAIHGYVARMLVTGGFEGLAWVTWDTHIGLFSNKLSPYQPKSLKNSTFKLTYSNSK